jgi:hypothetical protein
MPIETNFSFSHRMHSAPALARPIFSGCFAVSSEISLPARRSGLGKEPAST